MTAIRSNKALKYDTIKCLEGIIELKIIDVREFIESELFVISVQDSVVSESTVVSVDSEGVETSEVVETKTVLTTRMKQLTFAEVDGLEELLASQGPLSGTYMEKRLKLLQEGLLYITVSDEAPVYFSSPSDWVKS